MFYICTIVVSRRGEIWDNRMKWICSKSPIWLVPCFTWFNCWYMKINQETKHKRVGKRPPNGMWGITDSPFLVFMGRWASTGPLMVLIFYLRAISIIPSKWHTAVWSECLLSWFVCYYGCSTSLRLPSNFSLFLPQPPKSQNYSPAPPHSAYKRPWLATQPNVIWTPKKWSPIACEGSPSYFFDRSNGFHLLRVFLINAPTREKIAEFWKLMKY